MNSVKKDLILHEKILRNEIFFTETKWPHFNLLFEDIKKLSNKLPKNKTVVSLERNRLYGGISLFAPFFKQNFISIDCFTKNLFKRGAYNKHLTKNNKLLKIYNNYSFHYKNIKLRKNLADLVIIPNLIHHIEDLNKLILQTRKILKPNGLIYIFEPLIRELHQEPEDYVRFTPYGLKGKLKRKGFERFNIQYDGGPFTATAYCWDQALQYMPKKMRVKKLKWLNKNILYLKKLDKKYKKNLVRKNTTFPMSFSLLAVKR